MRSVPEWIGKTDNSMPTDACKRRILDRQGWRCAITGVEFRDGVKAEFDHIRPLWLDGENRETKAIRFSRLEPHQNAPALKSFSKVDRLTP